MPNTSKDKQLTTLQNWQRFVLNREPMPDHVDGVRPDILDSWRRALENGISPFEAKPANLTSEEIECILQKNRSLISVAHPYIENMYSYIKGTNHAIVLTEKSGYVIDLLSDDTWINKLRQKTGLYIGARRSEAYCGTNSIGICLRKNEPVHVVGTEHFIQPHHVFTCRAAPISDSEGKLIGCLALIGPVKIKSAHAMGMICAAADGISKELAMKNTLENIHYVNRQLRTTLESLSYGVVMIDADGVITQYNSKTLKILQLQHKDILGALLSDIIKVNPTDLPIEQLSQDIYDQEVRVTNPQGMVIYTSLSAKMLLNDTGEKIGTILMISKQDNVRKLVTRMSGFSAKYTFASIIGNSSEMQHAKRLGMIAANSTSNLLIQGESGTGKELFAQAVHNASKRATEPFIAINCASIPKSLIESELFGYERGAFTGANREGSPGKFELADGGTIFLDEIGDMSIELQASLLRVLQNKEIVRIGGKQPKKIDVRVISATNKNLLQSVTENHFRGDLYYRLNVLSISLSPLRERRGDIAPLISHFTDTYSSSRDHPIILEEDAKEMLEAYSWPGNVRELENVIERMVNLAQSDVITKQDLPSEITRFQPLNTLKATPGSVPAENNTNASPNHYVSVSQEYNRIVESLQKEHGDVSSVSHALGIPKRTLYRKFKKYNIELEQYRKW